MTKTKDKFETEMEKIQTELKQIEDPTKDQQANLQTIKEFFVHAKSCQQDKCKSQQHMDKVKVKFSGKSYQFMRRIVDIFKEDN